VSIFNRLKDYVCLLSPNRPQFLDGFRLEHNNQGRYTKRLLRQMIDPNIAIKICSGKSYDDRSYGMLLPKVDDRRMALPSV